MVAPVGAQSERIHEASGITRLGDDLYIADDSVGGACFRIAVPRNVSAVFPLNGQQPRRVRLAGGRQAVDLEGIDVLADGRLAVLSERTRSLIGEDQVIAEYDQPLGEFAKRGLEGISARPLSGGSSRVAVVWEGGYPDPPSVPRPMMAHVGRRAMRAFVLIHDLKPEARDLRIRLLDAVTSFEVDLPLPPGEEPLAQRFRASDLVWTRLPDSSADPWGLILLISSQNSVDQPTYQYHWLQRFNLQGKPVGPCIDLDKVGPPSTRGANWEGLAWLEAGQRLILVHEDDAKLEAHGLILDLPPEWRFPGKELANGKR